ncbi:hypothetical protein ACFX1W_043436 [Malus domestica]
MKKFNFHQRFCGLGDFKLKSTIGFLCKSETGDGFCRKKLPMAERVRWREAEDHQINAGSSNGGDQHSNLQSRIRTRHRSSRLSVFFVFDGENREL